MPILFPTVTKNAMKKVKHSVVEEEREKKTQDNKIKIPKERIKSAI